MGEMAEITYIGQNCKKMTEIINIWQKWPKIALQVSDGMGFSGIPAWQNGF